MKTQHKSFPPKSEPFNGFIFSIQGNVDSYIEYKSGSIFQNSSVHQIENAFKYEKDEHPAATEEEKWIYFTIKNYFFYITHYELKQRKDYISNLLTNWSFEGSNDETDWTLLDQSATDESFNKTDASKLFPCKRGIYQNFRLTELKEVILTVQRIDIYGILCQSKEICMQHLYMKTSVMRNIPIKLLLCIGIMLTS